MAKFTYEVQDMNGKKLRGSIEADSREKVVFALQNKGYIVVDVKEGGSNLFGGPGGPKKTGKVPGHVLAFFAEQLSTLIAGGVPLVRAISLLGEYASNPMLGTVLTQVAKDIAGGSSLHTALSRHKRTFSTIWLSLVQAGEVGGQLADTLMQVAKYTKTQEGMKSKIITAVTYPFILGKKRWHAFLLSMPLFGNFLKNIYYDRMLSTLSTLLQSGVTILNAIAVLEESFDTNIIIQGALKQVRAEVAAGRSISESFRTTGIFPGLMTEMMLMGEESGKLPSIIATLSKFYADQVDQFIARFSAVIDPILICGVGALIGVIVASIFLPIFKLSQIGGN